MPEQAANCSDISDFHTLSGSVGDEELDGAKILEQQREALRQKENYENAAEDMESIKNAETILTTYFGGYSVAEKSGKFVLDETKGEAIGKAAEGLASYAKKAGKPE